MDDFSLFGEDVLITHRDNRLFVGPLKDQGVSAPSFRLPGISGDGVTIADDRITQYESDIGRHFTAVLLLSDRRGVRYLLHLILPKTETGPGELDIAGVAIFVTDTTDEVGSASSATGAALQEYQVRTVRGSSP